MGYRVLGLLYCNGCHQRDQEFISYDPRCESPGLFECESCGYQYGNSVDQTEEDPGKMVTEVLTPEIVAAGHEKFRERWNRQREWNDIPLANPPAVVSTSP